MKWLKGPDSFLKWHTDSGQHPASGLCFTLYSLQTQPVNQREYYIARLLRKRSYHHIFDLSPVSLRWLPKSISHRGVLFISAIHQLHQVMGRYSTQQDERETRVDCQATALTFSITNSCRRPQCPNKYSCVDKDVLYDSSDIDYRFNARGKCTSHL